MKDITFEIKSNQKIAEKTYEMVLHHADENHEPLMPGQFINIKLEGYYLRRPISVCDMGDDTVTIIYKTVGQGTEAMSQYSQGKKLSVLTPLGNGFDTTKSGDRPLLIGGGAGVATMYGLCKNLAAEGKKPLVILGFNSAQEIFYTEKFQELTEDVIIATADGSHGIKGFVTDALTMYEATEKPPYTYFYTCGPEAMLKALDTHIQAHIDGQMSFEKRMGCGFGACMGCSCKTKYGKKRICKEGPVLERGEILW